MHFAAGQVTSSQLGPVMVGFYVESASGSTATPQISKIIGPSGPLARVVLPERGGGTPSKSLFVTYMNAGTATDQNITIDVVEPGKKLGNFTLKAFLPGDTNADGTVDQTDLGFVQVAYKTALGEAKNNPAADFNADGYVGSIDLRVTQMNQGARITYTQPSAGALTPSAAPATTPATSVTVASTPVATTTTTSVATPGSVPGTAATTVTATRTTTVPTNTATPASPPVTQPTPYLAYVYPQTGQIVPIAALPTVPAYYYGQPVMQPANYAPATMPVASAPPVPQIPTGSMPVYYSAPQ